MAPAAPVMHTRRTDFEVEEVVAGAAVAVVVVVVAVTVAVAVAALEEDEEDGALIVSSKVRTTRRYTLQIKVEKQKEKERKKKKKCNFPLFPFEPKQFAFNLLGAMVKTSSLSPVVVVLTCHLEASPKH